MVTRHLFVHANLALMALALICAPGVRAAQSPQAQVLESLELKFDGDEVQAVVMLSDGQVLAVSQESPCYYSALDVLADRMKEAVRRRVERRETARRRRRRLRRMCPR